MAKRPYTQTELATGLERWFAVRRGLVEDGEKASWEKDLIFMGLALSLWPVDMEAAAHGGYGGDTSRMRLRLRWEGFRALADVRMQLQALLQTADFIKAELQAPLVVPHRSNSRRTGA